MTAFARYWLPPLLWMAMIWGLSTDIGSADTTTGLFGWLVSQIFPWATPDQIRFAHDLVRKLGHLIEYAILAALWFRALHAGRGLPSASSAWTALSISIGWAIVDELHQAFVPSRTASPLDVLLDALGATLATVTAHTLIATRRTLPASHPGQLMNGSERGLRPRNPGLKEGGAERASSERRASEGGQRPPPSSFG